MEIDIQEAQDIIRSTNGRVFGAEFIKKDDTVRKMACRLGVRKGVKGVDIDRAKDDKRLGLLTVYDFNANGFRRINLKTLRRITFQKQTFKVKQNGI